MRRKVNNSETHETKRYYEVPPEKVQEWSDTIEKLTKQRDQYKTERDTLIDDLSWYKAKVSRLEREKKEREKRAEEAMTLAEEANCQVVSLQELLEINESSTKDLILKLQNSDTQKIEDENKELKRLAESRKGTIKGLKRHVKDLRLQSDTYFEQWQQHKALNNEFSQHIGNKPSSSTYKYFRAKLDDLNITEDK